MDYTAVLTTLWGKVTKPIPNLLIGATFIKFAPADWNWFGYIFFCFAGSGFADWLQVQLCFLYEKDQQRKKLKKTLQRLTNSERALLKSLVMTDTQTIHKEQMKSSDITTCLSLQDKGVFIKSENMSSFSLSHQTLDMLRELAKKDKDYFAITLSSGKHIVRVMAD